VKPTASDRQASSPFADMLDTSAPAREDNKPAAGDDRSAARTSPAEKTAKTASTKPHQSKATSAKTSEEKSGAKFDDTAATKDASEGQPASEAKPSEAEGTTVKTVVPPDAEQMIATAESAQTDTQRDDPTSDQIALATAIAALNAPAEEKKAEKPEDKTPATATTADTSSGKNDTADAQPAVVAAQNGTVDPTAAVATPAVEVATVPDPVEQPANDFKTTKSKAVPVQAASSQDQSDAPAEETAAPPKEGDTTSKDAVAKDVDLLPAVKLADHADTAKAKASGGKEQTDKHAVSADKTDAPQASQRQAADQTTDAKLQRYNAAPHQSVRAERDAASARDDATASVDPKLTPAAKSDLTVSPQLQLTPATSPAPASAAQAQSTNVPAVAVPIEGVAVEIASKALEGKNRFEIRLDPPELGRIHVRLDVDRDGQITSRVTADRQDTLDLLRRDAPQLQRALNDAGLRTADNGLQFSLRDQSANRQHQQPANDTAHIIVHDNSLANEAVQHGYYRLAAARGGLDIRV
jgi:flagellar hook-length control protein FliK